MVQRLKKYFFYVCLPLLDCNRMLSKSSHLLQIPFEAFWEMYVMYLFEDFQKKTFCKTVSLLIVVILFFVWFCFRIGRYDAITFHVAKEKCYYKEMKENILQYIFVRIAGFLRFFATDISAILHFTRETWQVPGL